MMIERWKLVEWGRQVARTRHSAPVGRSLFVLTMYVSSCLFPK